MYNTVFHQRNILPLLMLLLLLGASIFLASCAGTPVASWQGEYSVCAKADGSGDPSCGTTTLGGDIKKGEPQECPATDPPGGAVGKVINYLVTGTCKITPVE